MTVPRNASLGIGERAQLDLFRSVPGDLAPRDAQDLMTWPFFSLAKSKRVTPIDFRMGETCISVEAVPEHGMATIWDADVLIWATSQIVEARDAGHPTSRLMATTPHEILSYVGRGTGRDNYVSSRPPLRPRSGSSTSVGVTASHGSTSGRSASTRAAVRSASS
jgi:plasmid replication initiation protein